MSKLRYKSFKIFHEGKRRFRIEKLTLFGWEWLTMSCGHPLFFDTKREAETFINKYNSLKK